MRKQSHRNSVLTLTRLLVVSWMIVGCSLVACSLITERKARYAEPTLRGETQADGLLPLPEFTACGSTVHPTLPGKWKAVALMQDFLLNSLMFANLTYDQSAQAFRFILADRYGLELDLLVTQDGKLYFLEGGGDMPSSCTYIAAHSPFTMPARDWLNVGSVCVGEAAILEKNQLWWKAPSGAGANWFWFNVDNRLPFRQMFYADPQSPAPIYEFFTFNYFPSFEAVGTTNLPQILQMCQASSETPQPFDAFDINDIDSLVKSNDYPTSDPDTIALIQTWIPGLSECSSLGSLPPPWPNQVQGAVFMTAVSFTPNPFPTRVYYDWNQKAQNTSLYYNPATSIDYVQVALLTGDTGYIRIEDSQGGISMCEQALPGPQVPNWNEVDGCECRMQIAPGSILNPSTVPTKILWCPTDLSAFQVFWTWYSDEGDPVVFMQSNSNPTAGTGLNLADYYGWSPGSVAPPGTFDIPAACQGKPKIPVPQACYNCHSPRN